MIKIILNSLTKYAKIIKIFMIFAKVIYRLISPKKTAIALSMGVSIAFLAIAIA
jgi:hypothetical protein